MEERTDPAVLERLSTDFGGVVERRPAVSFRVETAADVAEVVRLARARGAKLVARGRGHTTSGQSLVAGGVVLETAGLGGVDLGHGRASVGAGATWADLVRIAGPEGWLPPVLTDFLGLSVGGTLSIGGVGGQSFRHGLQTCNVEELEVVTGTGEVVTCSPRRRPDLFAASLGGLGQCAVLVRAVVRLVEVRPVAVVLKLPYPSLRALLADQLALADPVRLGGRFDYLLASMVPTGGAWTFGLEAVRTVADPAEAPTDALVEGLGCIRDGVERTELATVDHACRLDGLDAAMLAAGRFHPWMDLFLPAPRAEEVIDAALRELDPGELAAAHLMTYALDRAAVRTSVVRLPDAPQLVLFDVLPTFTTPDQVARFGAARERILAHARRIGGTVYPIGFPVGTPLMTPADWRGQLDWERLARAKRAHDPDGVLGGGWGAFGAA